MSKRRAALFISWIEAGTSVKWYVLSLKNSYMNITNFSIFRIWARKTCDWEVRVYALQNIGKSVNTSGHPFSIINWSCDKARPKILCRLSLAQSALKVKNYENCDSWHWFLFNCESTCDLRLVSASINDRKTKVRHFETIHDEVSVFIFFPNIFSKAGMRQFGASGNQRIWDSREPTS